MEAHQLSIYSLCSGHSWFQILGEKLGGQWGIQDC